MAIETLSESAFGDRLREFTLRTPSLVTPEGFPLGANPGGATGVRVLLPNSYSRGERRYPVLYLLHGGGEDFRAWTSPQTAGAAEQTTVSSEFIVVMPDGGAAGGYANWLGGSERGVPQWMTYHLEELVPWVDARFRSVSDRAHRAIAGLSMGGAAVRYAAQRPDLFGATASFSGDIDILQPASEWRNAGRQLSSMIWGDPQAERKRWEGVNGPDLAENLANTRVALFAGDTGAPEATFILPAARAMHSRLEELGIPHEYHVYPGMEHSWATFNRAFEDWLPSLTQFFGEDSRDVRVFDYKSILGDFSMFGWSVHARQSGPEMTHLRVESNSRFTLTAAGDAEVTTPADEERRHRLAVVKVRARQSELRNELRADARGRLQIAVPSRSDCVSVQVEWG